MCNSWNCNDILSHIPDSHEISPIIFPFPHTHYTFFKNYFKVRTSSAESQCPARHCLIENGVLVLFFSCTFWRIEPKYCCLNRWSSPYGHYSIRHIYLQPSLLLSALNVCFCYHPWVQKCVYVINHSLQRLSGIPNKVKNLNKNSRQNSKSWLWQKSELHSMKHCS